MTLGRFVGHIVEKAMATALDGLPMHTPLGVITVKLNSNVHRVRLVAHVGAKRHFVQAEFTDMMYRAAANRAVPCEMGRELGQRMLEEILLNG